MLLTPWLRNLRNRLRRPVRRVIRSGRQSSAPITIAAQVQSLENRMLLSAVAWTGGGGDMQWNNAANWSGNATPGATDDVTIGNVSSSPITVSGADVSIHSLNSSNAIEVMTNQFSVAAASTVYATFNVDNAGLLAVQSGTLSLYGGGTSSGSVTVAAGAELDLGGTQNLTATSSVSGGGTVEAAKYGTTTLAGTYTVTGSTVVGYAGTADFTGTVNSVGSSLSILFGNSVADFGTTALSVQQLEIDGGILTAGDVTVANQFVWNGGTVGGTGTLTVENNPVTSSNLAMGPYLSQSYAVWTLDGKTLDNQGQGVMDVSGTPNNQTFNFKNGATFLNEGTFAVQSNAYQVAFYSTDSLSESFVNTGTFTASAGGNGPIIFSGVAVDNSGVFDAKSGTIQFITSYTQTAGVTKLDGGSIVTSNPLDIQGGVLDGSGAITGGVNNAGTTSPGFSPGLITISGDYTQQPSGQLNIELGGTTPGTQYDQVDVGGNVSLAGALNVSFINAFSSTAGETFTIIQNNGPNPVSGTFAGLAQGAFITVGGRQFQISYTSGSGHDVTLTDNPYVVTNTNDSGAGSLRQAILEADGNAGAHTITFDIPGSGVQVISPLSALPEITNSVTIDATTQPGYGGTPIIELNGANARSGNVDGLSANAAPNTTIRGLDIQGFSRYGIEIIGPYSSGPALGIVVEDCYVGVDATGNIAAANDYGIVVSGVDGIQLANNVISGNTASGLYMSGVHGSVIVGNFVGTNAAGADAVGNGSDGIALIDDIVNCTIGGTEIASRNVISGNHYGLELAAAQAMIEGNYIGTNAAGNAALANGASGIFASGNSVVLVGGTAPGAGNLISGNAGTGVDHRSDGNVVEGNRIGTDASGTYAIGNNWGVLVANASNNVIGGGVAGAGNQISGNLAVGINLVGADGGNNVIQGNLIGTDAKGTSSLSNTWGIAVQSAGNLIGTNGDGVNDAAERNIISGNSDIGVFVVGATTFANTIAGNYIGTDATGTAPLGNGSGVRIDSSAHDNVIGTIGTVTDVAGTRNIISANAGDGIYVNNAGSGNVIGGNYIGTDVTGNIAEANANGVVVNSVDGVHIANNVISGNKSDGALLNFDQNIIITGNRVGTNAVGTAALGNGSDGIGLSNDTNVTVGGTNPGDGNLISGNRGTLYIGENGAAGSGVYLAGSGSVVIQGNLIGTDATGTVALANAADGIKDTFGSGPITIGGTTAAARNVVSGNRAYGIEFDNISGSATVQGNYVGTNATGAAALGNGAGIDMFGGGSVLIGGTDPGAGNLVSGNYANGIQISTSGNVIQGNLIGTDATGTARLGNSTGIYVASGVNLIGTNGDGVNDAAERNIISGNSGYGVYLHGASATGNTIAGNYIGTDITGTAALGDSVGVQIDNGAHDNVIGTNGAAADNAGMRNIISANGDQNIFLNSAGAGNVIAGNYIGTDVTGTQAVGSSQQGIYVYNTSGVVFGTNGDGVGDVAERNVISGNWTITSYTGYGLVLQDDSNAVVAGNYFGVDASGTQAVGSGDVGIIMNTSSGIRIGVNGDDHGAVAERNLIAGNWRVDVQIGTSTNDVVAGNYVGLNASGTRLVGTSQWGVYAYSSSGIRIGTGGAGTGDAIERNVVAINGSGFAVALDQHTNNSEVVGNYVGTDATGAVGLGNVQVGIAVWGTADVLEGNVVAGNYSFTDVKVVSSQGVVIAANYIGVDATGTHVVGASQEGIYVANSSGIVIGTNGEGVGDAAERNVVCGTGFAGVFFIDCGSGNNVAGNFIGTDATGTQALGNEVFGILAQDSLGLLIGTTGAGPSAAGGNVVSGGNNYGVAIKVTQPGASSGTIVAGNLIGTDVSGTKPLGNALEGIDVFGSATDVQISSNVISANGQYGIRSGNYYATLSRSHVTISGNEIGTDLSGTLNLGNGADGIRLDDYAQNFTIGGTGAGQANIIAFNHGNGVVITGNNSFGNSIRGNVIFANTGLGIDLGNDGVTPNHAGGFITGPNGFENFPVLTLVQAGSTTHIVGTVQSGANESLTIDFYSNPAAAPFGHGQGQTYLGSTVVTTDGNGNATFDLTLATSLGVGSVVSATATNPAGNTSEFSVDQTVVADAPLTDTTPVSTINAVEGNSTGNVVLATFTSADPDALQSNFTPGVTWGAALVGTGTDAVQLVSRSATASYWEVVGSATYAETGNNAVAVTVTSAGGSTVSTSNTTISVADAPLTDATVAATVNAVEGNSPGSIVLATFTDANPYAALSDFTAAVNWGNGTVIGTPAASVQFVSQSAGVSTWQVVGSVTYAAKGSDTVAVTVNDADGSSVATSQTTVSVADAPLTDTTPATTLNAVAEYATGTVVLATFTDANPSAPLSDYTPAVNWGGTLLGTPTVSVQFVSSGGGVSTWQVLGSATYSHLGTYTVAVTVNDVDGAAFTTNMTTFNVSPAPSILTDTTPAATDQAIEGNSTGPVVLATFSDSNPHVQASDYNVGVNWNGTLVGLSGALVQLVSQTATASNWKIVGNATYLEKGTYDVTGSVSDAGGGSLTDSQTTFDVDDAPLTDTTLATTINAVEGVSTGTVVLATFTDGNPYATAGDFTARVDWGATHGGDQGGDQGGEHGNDQGGDQQGHNEGDHSGDHDWDQGVSVQFVSSSPAGSVWHVVGSATYLEVGNHIVTVTVRDKDGMSFSTSNTTVSVADAPLTDTTPVATLNAVQGNSTGTIVVATFSDGNPYATADDFTAHVDWGGTLGGNQGENDGGDNSGDHGVSVQFVSSSSAGSVWQMVGSATYLTTGKHTVTVTVSDKEGMSFSTGNTTVSVAAAPLTDTTRVQTLTAVEGRSTGNVVLATFTDANPYAAVSDLTASVNWGGALIGTPTVAVHQVDSGDGSVSKWEVVGSAVYVTPGTYNVTVTVNSAGGSSVTTNNTSFSIADASLTDDSSRATVNATSGQSTGDVVLAVFAYGDPYAVAGDFVVGINWGGAASGTAFRLVEISQSKTQSLWEVIGSATYTADGTFTAAVTVSDLWGATILSKDTKFRVTG